MLLRVRNGLHHERCRAAREGSRGGRQILNYNFGFEVKQTGQGYHVAKPGFDLMISQEFLQSVDYTELRKIELVMRDLMKD